MIEFEKINTIFYMSQILISPIYTINKLIWYLYTYILDHPSQFWEDFSLQKL